MFIICPKCGAKYKIPAGTTLESGQKLKCSACDFIFQKGEEAPLPLTDTAESSAPSPTPASEKPKAFSEPMYHESDLNISPKDSFSSLPEAFQPVSAPRSEGKGLWILLPLYAVIIVVLCIAGWSFRELLKPSFAGYLPRQTVVHTTPKITPRPVVRPTPQLPKPTFPKQQQKPTRVTAPAQTPSVSGQTHTIVTEGTSLPTYNEPKPTKKTEPIIDPKPFSPQSQIVDPLPIPTRIKDNQEPAVKTKNPKQDKTPATTDIKPQPKGPEKILPETDTFSLPEQQTEKLDSIIPTTPVTDEPLFEVVADKQPMPKALTVQNLDFKINQNPEGISHLLIDGALKNTGDKSMPIPMLTAFVFDKDGHVLTQKQIYVSETEITPNQEIPFYTGIVPSPENVHHVDIKF